MSLSASQRLAGHRVSPRRFAEMERDSRDWGVDGACGFRANLREIGGIGDGARAARGPHGARAPAAARATGFAFPAHEALRSAVRRPLGAA